MLFRDLYFVTAPSPAHVHKKPVASAANGVRYSNLFSFFLSLTASLRFFCLVSLSTTP